MKFHSKSTLTQSSGRVALCVGIVAGMVSQQEIKAAIAEDIEPRQYRKPVVAKNIRYDSIIEAAIALCDPGASHRKIHSMSKNIANWCNADTVHGFYWTT